MMGLFEFPLRQKGGTNVLPDERFLDEHEWRITGRRFGARCLQFHAFQQASTTFPDLSDAHASSFDFGQTRCHGFVGLRPCFRMQWSRCGPIDATKLNDPSSRANPPPGGLLCLCIMNLSELQGTKDGGFR